jgi:poly(A) polymerase
LNIAHKSKYKCPLHPTFALRFMFKEAIQHPIFTIVSDIAAESQQPCYVIGGYVRDFLLERPSKDADIVVLGDGIEIATQVAKRLKLERPPAIFKTFGTAMINIGDFEVEFVGARKESYQTTSRKPQVTKGTLEDDQKRRDFTINALAISLNKENYGEFVDPFKGLLDLKNQIIKTPLDPHITFSDDPLRMMRAIRFASQLQFTISEETLHSITENAHRIEIVSMERISDELNKIIMCHIPSIGFKLLFDTGLLKIIFPELAAMQGIETINGKSHKDNFYHTLQVLDQICPQTDDLWLRWSAILHDIAKPATKRFNTGEGFTFHGHEDRGARMVKQIFRRMKLPMNEKMNFVEKMVMLHLRPKALAESEQTTDSGFRRLIVDAGEDINALFTLCHADITSKNKQKVEKYRRNLEAVRERVAEVEQRDDLRNWQPPVDGIDIMNFFNIKPGREVGLIKTAIREAILEGDIANTREAALELMKHKGLELGLKIHA